MFQLSSFYCIPYGMTVLVQFLHNPFLIRSSRALLQRTSEAVHLHHPVVIEPFLENGIEISSGFLSG